MNNIKDYSWDFIKSSEDNTRNFYYCTSKDGQVYVVSAPANIDTNTKVAYYIPGTGGAYTNSTNDNASIDYYLSGMNSDANTILIGYKEAQPYANTTSVNGTYASYNYEILNEVINEYNLNSNQVDTFIGWSNGAGISLQMGIDYLKDEKEKNGIMNPRIFCMVNSAGYAPDVINEDDIKLIAESNSSIFVVTENLHQNAYNEYLNWSKKYGINIIRINCYGNFDSVHSTGNYNFAKNGGIDFLTGNGNYSSEYFDSVLEKYDPETDSWFKLTASEAQEYLSIVSTNYNSFDDYINSISQTLSPSSFNKINIESTTNVPNICIDAFNNLVNCSNSLIDKISEELNSLLKVKDSIEQMDNQLYEESQYLNMNINSQLFEMVNIANIANEPNASEELTLDDTAQISSNESLNENDNSSVVDDISKEDIIQINDNGNSYSPIKNQKASMVYNEEFNINDGNFNIKVLFEKMNGNIIGIKEGYFLSDFENITELENYIYKKYNRKIDYNIINDMVYVPIDIDDYNRLYNVG